jgi:hypothetical protein
MSLFLNSALSRTIYTVYIYKFLCNIESSCSRSCLTFQCRIRFKTTYSRLGKDIIAVASFTTLTVAPISWRKGLNQLCSINLYSTSYDRLSLPHLSGKKHSYLRLGQIKQIVLNFFQKEFSVKKVT